MNSELSLRKPHLIRNCRYSSTPQQGDVLLMPEGVIRLKGSGAEIVKLCDGTRTVAEIALELKARFVSQDSGQIERDLMEFLAALKEKRVMDF